MKEFFYAFWTTYPSGRHSQSKYRSDGAVKRHGHHFLPKLRLSEAENALFNPIFAQRIIFNEQCTMGTYTEVFIQNEGFRKMKEL